ncbi:hypothetical protein K3495_g16795 [Podosphaera aphanis]|nr:hypothetical protein K3495_g16795 [Podosphaera aphanis]
MVKESIIEIGDQERGEKLVKIQGPIFVEGGEHKLVLCPKRKRKVVFVESSSEESEEDEDSEEEDSSDDESLSELFGNKKSVSGAVPGGAGLAREIKEPRGRRAERPGKTVVTGA